MRLRVIAVSAVSALALGGGVWAAMPADAGTSPQVPPLALKLGRQVLGSNDGWAASGTGTTGGSAADDAHITVVHNRPELVAALGGDNTTNAKNATSKIIFVNGVVDGNTDDNNNPLTCDDYAAGTGYTLPAFLAAYDPAVWGRTSKPSGTLEAARVASTKIQAAHVAVTIGSNTTIIGLRGARVTGANFVVGSGVDNVIIRNLEFQDAHDCFPAWDPTDGSTGNWNSNYDTMSVTGGTHVWVDHNTFSDGTNLDTRQPVYFGRPYQVHDGLLDITKAADLVTVSYNYLHDHDKTMLIGSSDTSTTDPGKLRVTLHDNRFQNVGQRAPRVRFGQVHVYNNLYQIPQATGPWGNDGYQYSWGVGKNSALYAQNNFFDLGTGVSAADVVHYWGGTAMTEQGTLVRAGGKVTATSVLAAYNAANTPTIGTDAGWTPTLHKPVLPTVAVPLLVLATAGAHCLLS